MSYFSHSWPGVGRVLLIMAGCVTWSGAARCQTVTAPAEVALKLVAALKSHDNKAAASYLVAASRDDFNGLMDASAAVAAAHTRLNAVAATRFGDAATLSSSTQTGPDTVLRADITSQTEVNTTTVDLGIDLVTTAPTALQHIIWRAVQEDGTWKIELPACASPTAAGGLKQRMTQLTGVADKITAELEKGTYASAVEARNALTSAERAAIPATRP